ncbi:MAG TPA: TetR-like C-terminal domain-containing protein [Rhizobiaceae bacterium]|nr:TetR-like C-terminal domain-containing protein [Rhizobiaceae bacterium]
MTMTSESGPHDGSGARRYHHGDLRTALLAAAEAELAEKGVEGFTLRGCARRAGVSHAAPAHHFRDANALLTALAGVGFERFVASQKEAMAEAPSDPRSQLVASGIGNIRFALASPALFRLIFSSDRPDFDIPDLQRPATVAFTMLVDGVCAIRGGGALEDEAIMRDVYAAWAIAHGLADLLITGRMKHLSAMPQAERERHLAEIIGRSMPER